MYIIEKGWSLCRIAGIKGSRLGHLTVSEIVCVARE